MHGLKSSTKTIQSKENNTKCLVLGKNQRSLNFFWFGIELNFSVASTRRVRGKKKKKQIKIKKALRKEITV